MAVLKIYQSTSYIGNSGKAPLYVSFYLDRQKIVIACEISVRVAHFNSATGKITTGEKNHKDLNLIIDKIKARVNDVMVKYRLTKKKLTKDAFWKEYNRPDDFKTFYEFFHYYIKNHPNDIEPGTLDTHIDSINKLQRYAPELNFDDITEEFIKEYKVYLKKKLKNKESTATKNLAHIKKYVRLAIKSGYMSEDPFEDIALPRTVKGSFSFLTEDELKRLVELYQSETLSKEHQQALQFFLFMCFTSLHIGDAKSLRIEHIGTKSFTYYRIKNRNSKPEPIIVPISKPARSIIKQVAGRRRNGLLFQKLTADQTLNKYIKKIAKIADINKSLSNKSGRHTFATIFLQKTKDLATLKEILGHTDYRETLIYAHVLEESKLNGIKSFNNFVL